MTFISLNQFGHVMTAIYCFDTFYVHMHAIYVLGPLKYENIDMTRNLKKVCRAFWCRKSCWELGLPTEKKVVAFQEHWSCSNDLPNKRPN